MYGMIPRTAISVMTAPRNCDFEYRELRKSAIEVILFSLDILMIFLRINHQVNAVRDGPS